MSKAKAKAAPPARQTKPAAPATPAARSASETLQPIPPTRPPTPLERAQRGERGFAEQPGFTDTPPNPGTEHSTSPPKPTRTATGEKIVPPRARTRIRPEDEGPERNLGPLMTVRATQVGFVDNVRRRVDDVFDVHEAEFSEKWMEPVDGNTPRQITGPAAALKRAHDDTVAGRLKTPAHDPLGTESTSPRA